RERLGRLAPTRVLEGFARTAKQGAQGAALIADGPAGGANGGVVGGAPTRARGGAQSRAGRAAPDPRGAGHRPGPPLRHPARTGPPPPGALVTRVLIAGVSTRGLAESAARAGYEVVAIDGFGDLDLRVHARTVTVTRVNGRFSIPTALAVAREVPRDVTCYVASFENHPKAIEALARASPVWGSAPDVLARVRDPEQLARALAARGLPTPAVRRAVPTGNAGRRWLVKPRASGGGSGIVAWRGERVPARSYLQERVVGIPGSVVFAADGRRAVVLGISRALAGRPAFGATGFKYCGSILLDPEEPLFEYAGRLAAALTAEFGLVGVNGVDFVAAHGVPLAIEVNPRYTASMELVERAYGLAIFETHARACAGSLP